MAYDANFCFHLKDLQSDRLRVTPFIPDVHGELVHAAWAPHPEMWTWVQFGPFATASQLLAWHESYIRSQRDRTLFAVFDTDTGTERLAAVIGLTNVSVDNLCAELAYVFTLPAFQRTHVTTHGCGLLLNWCFDELKLRRVQWQANEMNDRSWRAAEKLGFRKEGVKRWERTLPPGKAGGHPARNGDPKKDWSGRHTVILAVCWDDWENGVKAVVSERMARI